MALTFSQNSGLNDDFWKPVGQVLKSVMKDTDTEKLSMTSWYPM